MNKLVRFDPFAELNALQRQLFNDDLFGSAKALTAPTTDIYTSKDGSLIVEAHLPNFSHDDVHVEVENGCLVIQAERHEKEEDKDKRYVVRESSSSFYRRVQLPERAEADKIAADLEDGILKVTVPMTPHEQPKKITVKAKASKKLSK